MMQCMNNEAASHYGVDSYLMVYGRVGDDANFPVVADGLLQEVGSTYSYVNDQYVFHG